MVSINPMDSNLVRLVAMNVDLRCLSGCLPNSSGNRILIYFNSDMIIVESVNNIRDRKGCLFLQKQNVEYTTRLGKYVGINA